MQHFDVVYEVLWSFWISESNIVPIAYAGVLPHCMVLSIYLLGKSACFIWSVPCGIVSVPDPKNQPQRGSLSVSRTLYWKQYTRRMRSGDETTCGTVTLNFFKGSLISRFSIHPPSPPTLSNSSRLPLLLFQLLTLMTPVCIMWPTRWQPLASARNIPKGELVWSMASGYH